MSSRTLRSGILAIGAAILCLSASLSGAGDTKTAKKDDAATLFRKAVLQRFDTNHNGRLDSKEKAAALRTLTSRDDSDDEVNALRAQILDRFDKNGNGKLERQEVRTALATVNAKSQPAVPGQPSATNAATGNLSDSSRVAAVIARDPSAAVVFAAQQIASTGIDAATAQELAVQKFDLNGDGVLDSSELALAQSMLLRQLAQLATTTSTLQTTPLLTSTSTGTTGTTTGTTNGTTTTGSMSGGCTSGTSGSSGTTSSGQSTGTTGSVAQAANNQAFSGLNSAAARSRGFGGGRGR